MKFLFSNEWIMRKEREMGDYDEPFAGIPLGATPTHRSAPLGPKQLQWCREHLGNFAAYESQVIAAGRGATQAETIAKERRHD